MNGKLYYDCDLIKDWFFINILRVIIYCYFFILFLNMDFIMWGSCMREDAVVGSGQCLLITMIDVTSLYIL